MVKTVLKIEGMACGMCEAHMNEAVRNAFRVKKVASSCAKGETEIISEEELDRDELAKVVSQTGYELKGIESGPFEMKKGLFGFIKKK